MKIADYIRKMFRRNDGNVLFNTSTGFYGGFQCTNYPFARLIFANICDLLTDLANDVTLTRKSGDIMNFAHFSAFFEQYGKYVLTRIFDQGFVVIARDKGGMYGILNPEEYTTQTRGNEMVVEPLEPSLKDEVYVMQSQTFRLYAMSDKMMCKPAMKMLDAILNSATTISERLGAFIIGTPATPSSSPIAGVLNEKQKKELEENLEKTYGSKDTQRQIMILPNDMKFQTINLSGLDIKMQDKVKTAILMICDRIQVPANQVAIIDAMSSKSFANGTEMREGDFNKYQSFERLLNETFIAMAKNYGLSLDYTIYNKPVRQQTTI